MSDSARTLPIRSAQDVSPLWRIAQYVALAALVVLLIGMVVEPELSLQILWYALIPLVPASLLVTPVLWRGVCPLATLNMAANGAIARKAVTGRLLAYSAIVGLVLLATMVPARRFIFNQHALILTATVIGIGILALALGAVFDAKAGFCSTICPVLPVERLYGQRPLLDLGNPRCPTCTHCTSRGCIDLAPTKSIAQVLGKDRRSTSWLTTSFGIFAASFPGFIVGYYTVADTTIASAGSVYLTVLMWAAASYLLFTAVIRVARINVTHATTVLAAAAAGLYYWFAAPGIADAFSLGSPVSTAIRIAGVGLVAFWFVRAMATGPERAAT